MLGVLQCTAKQMAHFLLETVPFLSMGILVPKEVLAWNHLSESHSGKRRCLRSFTTCMRDLLTRKQKKGEKLWKSKAFYFILSIHHPAAYGVFLRMCNPRFARNKFVRSGKHRAPGSVVTGLPSVRHPSSIRPAVHGFLLLCKNDSVLHPGRFPGQTSSPRTLQWWKVASMERYQCNSMYTGSLSETLSKETSLLPPANRREILMDLDLWKLFKLI